MYGNWTGTPRLISLCFGCLRVLITLDNDILVTGLGYFILFFSYLEIWFKEEDLCNRALLILNITSCHSVNTENLPNRNMP
jgi:hypothetical protein